MKRMLALMLCLFLCLLSAACSATEPTIEATTEPTTEPTTEFVDPNAPIRYEYHEDEMFYHIIYPSEQKLKDSLKKVALTTENWNTYIGDREFLYEYEETNNFGEVTQSVSETRWAFDTKRNYLITYDTAGLKFSGYTTSDGVTHDEEVTLDLDGWGFSGRHFEDHTCTAATGTLYVLDIGSDRCGWEGGTCEGYAIYVGDACYGYVDPLWHGGVDVLYQNLNS